VIHADFVKAFDNMLHKHLKKLKGNGIAYCIEDWLSVRKQSLSKWIQLGRQGLSNDHSARIRI